MVGRSIDAMVEVGAVGMATRRVPKDVAAPTLYAHATADSGGTGGGKGLLSSTSLLNLSRFCH
jgi:hypothetical protein